MLLGEELRHHIIRDAREFMELGGDSFREGLSTRIKMHLSQPGEYAVFPGTLAGSVCGPCTCTGKHSY